jgi:hypothetical protein
VILALTVTVVETKLHLSAKATKALEWQATTASSDAERHAAAYATRCAAPRAPPPRAPPPRAPPPPRPRALELAAERSEMPPSRVDWAGRGGRRLTLSVSLSLSLSLPAWAWGRRYIQRLWRLEHALRLDPRLQGKRMWVRQRAITRSVVSVSLAGAAAATPPLCRRFDSTGICLGNACGLVTKH